jgi:transcriptional regulator with XRE-family HTH domain
LVREERIEKGFSLRKFAELVGINPTYLSQVEQGNVGPPTVERVIRMAKLLGVYSDEWIVLARRLRGFASNHSETPNRDAVPVAGRQWCKHRATVEAPRTGSQIAETGSEAQRAWRRTLGRKIAMKVLLLIDKDK